MIEEARTFLLSKEWDLFSLVDQLCGLNSYTGNKPGNDEVARAIQQAFLDIDLPGGVTFETIEREDIGDILIVRTAACANHDKQILFCGHMDTVFPEGDGFDHVTPKGDVLTGPGVIDMKGGLVVAIFAAATLGDLGLLEDMPLTFVFNSDEETGSVQSRDVIIEEAKKSLFAFVFECSGLGGEVVTGRKGKATYKIEVTGKAGHPGVLAGRGATDKPSAILALAQKIVELESLNDVDKGISVNVGVARGGKASNIIPDSAEAFVDSRFVYRADGRMLDKNVRDLVQKSHAPGTSASVSVVSERPAMEQDRLNRALYSVVKETGDRLEIPVEEEFRGGVSDANFIAAAGCPVIDGMGPSGDKDHSHDEYMIRHTLLERTALAALSAAKCWEQFKNGFGNGS